MKPFAYLLLIIFLCTNIASAYDEDDLEWACGNSKELHLGETISNGNYTVKVYNFPISDRNESRFVGMRLYENGSPITDQTLQDGEEYIHDDEIRITVLEFSVPPSDWTTDLPEEPWARIKMEPRGVPRFDVEFETDKDEYPAYSSDIEVDLVIQNTGDSEAYNIDIDVDTGGLETTGGKVDNHCHNLEKGERLDGKTDTDALDPIALRFEVPSVIEDTMFNIAVKIECCDIKGIKYSYYESYPVKVLGMFRISKSINDNIYMGEIATITISLANDGTHPINSIRVSDTLPPDFELNENSSILWELDLGAGERRSFTYSLRPLQPNEEGYVIPAAIAEWTEDGKNYSARSDPPCITVYGPKIELSKTVTPETIDAGGIVAVTVEVANTGNVLASVDVTDSLPESGVLIDGVLGADAVLRAGESHVFGYTMQIDMDTAGSVELPPAVAHFVDTHEYKKTIASENESITVNPAATPRPAQTIDTSDQPVAATAAANTAIGTDEKAGLGPVCMLVGLFAAVFVIMRVRRR
ncbi:MAG: hypothetical protein U9Q37_02450 [Euryarchaeota archaeon]|nr:hypothetical protein [Euryarchaeota archaeon]